MDDGKIISVLKYNIEIHWLVRFVTTRSILETESVKRGPRYFHWDENINISMRSRAVLAGGSEHVVFPFSRFLEFSRTEAVQDGCC